jgi:hypothetical protein
LVGIGGKTRKVPELAKAPWATRAWICGWNATSRKKYLFLYSVTIGQHAFLMTGWAEIPRLAAKSQQVIMTAVIAVDARNAFMQVAAVDKPVQNTVLDLSMNGTACLQFVIVLTYTPIERTGPWIPWLIYSRIWCYLRATHLFVLRDERKKYSK